MAEAEGLRKTSECMVNELVDHTYMVPRSHVLVESLRKPASNVQAKQQRRTGVLQRKMERGVEQRVIAPGSPMSIARWLKTTMFTRWLVGRGAPRRRGTSGSGRLMSAGGSASALMGSADAPRSARARSAGGRRSAKTSGGAATRYETLLLCYQARYVCQDFVLDVRMTANFSAHD